MVNLLPTKEFHRVTWEHRRRIGVVALIFIACSMVLALLFIVPSAIIVWSAAGGFDEQLEATKTLVDLQRKQGGGDILNDISARADILETTLLQHTPTSILADIVPRIPNGVSVRQFSYSATGNVTTVSVLGTADTRAALIAFGDALRQSPLFSRVDVPVASLARSVDIDFSLTLTLDATVALETYLSSTPESVVTEETSTEPDTSTSTDSSESL